MTARVIALHVHERHGERPRAVREITARVGGGLDGDSHGDRAKRGVLVVDRATHDALDLRPGDLREQITIEGLPGITRLSPDAELRVGGVTLRVNGPCEPCTHIGDMLGRSDVEEFRLSLVGRRGALCTVVAVDGPVRIGDAVTLIPARVAAS